MESNVEDPQSAYVCCRILVFAIFLLFAFSVITAFFTVNHATLWCYFEPHFEKCMNGTNT